MQALKNWHNYLWTRPSIGVWIISAFYFFGAFGIMLGFEEWFVAKTAFNLLLSFLLLLIYQRDLDFRLVICLAACYIIGFGAEFLGVQYGLIFGSYHYPDTLGPQLFNVPIIIGINWFIITFCIWSLLSSMRVKNFSRVILATVLTVAIDVIIEPIAIALNFWQWENNQIPLQNYLGWAIIAFLIFCIYYFVQIPTKNKLASMLLVWQLIFFISLNFWFSF